MDHSSDNRQHFVLWGLLLGLWCLLVLAFAGQLVLGGTVTWTEALTASIRDWLPWLVLSPGVAWLALRFPLEQRRLTLSVPVHVAGCCLAVLFYEVVAPPPPRLPGGPQYRFRGNYPDQRRPFAPDRLPPGARPPARPLSPSNLRSSPAAEDGLPREGAGPALDSGRPAVHRPDRRGGLLNRARFNIPIYWVIVSIAHALTYYRRSEERARRALELESRLAEAKMQALRMQLHPHFLFNALNAISTLVHKDPQAADEMIGNLSELLRATLDRTEQVIPLREELALLDHYLQIQQTRFGDRLQVKKEIDAAALEVEVPTFILQPLVENAIRHGIEPQSAPGLVTISARSTNEMLTLTVRDNGPGMKMSAEAPQGIGLSNTRARLVELYGSAARLVFNSSSEGGCSVELEIPRRAGIPGAGSTETTGEASGDAADGKSAPRSREMK